LRITLSNSNLANKDPREDVLCSRWSGIKQHASTSRVSTCPRFDKELNEGLASYKSSHIF